MRAWERSAAFPPASFRRYKRPPPADISFTLTTTVRNIDDPFDGTATGNPPPVDTAPADYKLVDIGATCPLCDNAFDETITTTVAPKNLESATADGSLVPLRASTRTAIQFPAPWCMS